MSPIDVVNGGAGTDTFKISAASALTSASLAIISNVETLEIAAVSTLGAVGVNDVVADGASDDAGGVATAAFDVSTIAGLTTLNVTKAASTSLKAAATTDVSVSGATGGVEVNGGKNVTVTDAADGNNITVGSTVVAVTDDTNTAGTAAAGTVTVTDTKQNAGIIQVDGGTDVTVTTTSTLDNGVTAVGALKAATGAVSVTANLNGDGTATLDQGDITVKGGSTVTVASTLTINAKNESADAANTLGDVTVTGDGKTTSVTVNQTYAETEFTKAAVAVVKETSVVTFAELKQGETLIINGLTFTAAKDLTAEQAAAAFASLTAADTQAAGGATANGLYTGTFDSAVWTSAAVSGKTVTFTATDENEDDLAFTGTAATMPTQVKATGTAVVAADTSVNSITYGAVRIDDVAAAAITTVTLNGYSTADLGKTGTDLNALTSLSLTNGGAVELATSATTLGLTLNKVSGVIDLDNTGATVTALNVTTATADSASAMVAAAVKDLTVTGTNALNLTGATMGALETVVVSGSAGLNLGAVTAAKSITTTTTGTVTATIDAGVATYTGGAGVDNVTTVTTTTPTKAISLGAGNDKLTLASGTTSSTSTLAGGDGADTLSMVAANAVTASGSAAFATKVTSFEKLVLTGATGAQEVEADVLGNFNDVEISDAIAGHTLTLDGVTSGATIRLNDNSNVQTIAMVTDAGLVANSTDVVNIVIGASDEDGTADDNGIVRADDVEKINISVTDISVVQTPTDTKADAQSLTLNATKATTITITGDTALTLNTALNQKVTAINAADFTGALTVTAAGGVASTITGGSGKDVLTASTGAAAVNTANATGVAATLSDSAIAGANEKTTIAFASSDLAEGESVTVAGLTLTLNNDGDADTVTITAANVAAAFASLAAGATAGNAPTLTGNTTDPSVTEPEITWSGTFTGFTSGAAAGTDVVLTSTAGGDPAAPTVAATGATAPTVGAPTVAVKENVTLDVTAEFSNAAADALDQGDSISLTVAGTNYSYTVTSTTMTVDAANAELLTLAKANALIDATSSYDTATDTFTFVAATAGATGITVGSDYTVTDAAGGAAKGDILVGGAGNDTLTAGSLATLTGGNGADTFIMVTGLANINSYSTITDFLAGDKIDTSGTDFVSAGVNLASTAVFSDFVNAAIAQTDTGDVIWFQKDGNTYVVQNESNHATNFDVTQDFIIAITGLVDLSAASFNTTNGFLEMA